MRELPRWSLAVASVLVGGGLAYGAVVLPWRTWTSFGVLTLGLGVLHGVTAILCVVGSAWRGVAWRVQSLAAIGYLGWLAYGVAASAAYMGELYGGLGRGVAAVIVAFTAMAGAFVLPPAVWCFAVSVGARRRRRAGVAGVVALALLGAGVWRTAASASPRVLLDRDAVELVPMLQAGLPGEGASAGAAMTLAPAVCATPPGPDTVTIVAAFATAEGPAIECMQAADLEGAVAALHAQLQPRARGRIAIDVIIAHRELAPVDPVADLFALRPGLDGVCEDARCLMPWQLVAMQAFSAVAPVDVLHEIRVGFDPQAIRTALDPSRPAASSTAGLVRIETASFATDAHGRLHALRRLRVDRPDLDASSLHAALRAAEDYIASAQLPDGRFEYTLDPFTGALSMDGFSIARQAGTTLVMCELAEDPARAAAIADASLRVLADAGSRHGEMLMLHDPGDEQRWFDLGDTALGAIAFLSCRPLVGDRFDGEIDGLTRFLLAMQRDDGSFHPQFDLECGEIVRGPDPLFAVGQAVLALVLLEQLQPRDDVRDAVEAAMDYVAGEYWNGFAADFFYMEENWHCLAARAALPHHRHDGYEQFCVDYVRWKTRLVLDETDGVDPDLVGGYGFGNVVLPWSAGSATFGEAAAAALVIADARGLPRDPIQSRLRLALGFLVHQQWKDAECFACSASHPIAGAWSEHPGSPPIRIDFVQHAMGALGHGGRALGLR